MNLKSLRTFAYFTSNTTMTHNRHLVLNQGIRFELRTYRNPFRINSDFDLKTSELECNKNEVLSHILSSHNETSNLRVNKKVYPRDRRIITSIEN